MGFLKHLLFWPVSGPTWLAKFSLEQVEGTVRKELTDEGRVKEELLELQLRLELGEVDEEEFGVREAELMERMREVRRWREELGMAPAWGPLTVGGDDRGPEVEVEGLDEVEDPDEGEVPPPEGKEKGEEPSSR